MDMPVEPPPVEPPMGRGPSVRAAARRAADGRGSSDRAAAVRAAARRAADGHADRAAARRAADGRGSSDRAAVVRAADGHAHGVSASPTNHLPCPSNLLPLTRRPSTHQRSNRPRKHRRHPSQHRHLTSDGVLTASGTPRKSEGTREGDPPIRTSEGVIPSGALPRGFAGLWAGRGHVASIVRGPSSACSSAFGEGDPAPPRRVDACGAP
jgi:hypothetical protein